MSALKRVKALLAGFPRAPAIMVNVADLRELVAMVERAEEVRALTERLYEGVQNGAGCCGPVIGRGSRLRQVLYAFSALATKRTKGRR